MNIPERISALRALMEERGYDVYMVPTDDFHQSEYVGDHFKVREYITGFTGSAGTAVFTKDEAGLWTDGRYFLQADQQLAGTGVKLYKMGEPGVPTVEEFIASALPEGGTLGFDGRVVAIEEGAALEEAVASKDAKINYSEDLVGEVWADRPALSEKPAFALGEEYTGESTESKLARVREAMKKAGADGSSLWHSEKLPDRNKAEVKQEAWFQNAQKNIETIHYGEKKLVQPDKARYVYEISRYIEYVENGNMKSGVLLLEYYTDSIDEVLLHYKSQKSAYCYLLDTNRRLLYHPFEKEIASEMYQEKTVKEAMACKNYKIEEQSGGKWLIERQQIGYTGWNVVLVNSMSSLDFESYNLHYVAWFTLLLVGVILIFLDILLFRSFTDPVYRLLQTMQEFGKGNYDIKAKEEGIGELKNLSAHFNIMADKLQEQMEEMQSLFAIYSRQTVRNTTELRQIK